MWSGGGQLCIQIDAGIAHLGQFVSERARADTQLLRRPVASTTLFFQRLDDNPEFTLSDFITQ